MTKALFSPLAHSTAEANLELIGNIRFFVWQAQQRLLAEPDPEDPWAFLIDPSIQLEHPVWD